MKLELFTDHNHKAKNFFLLIFSDEKRRSSLVVNFDLQNVKNKGNESSTMAVWIELNFNKHSEGRNVPNFLYVSIQYYNSVW